MAGEDVLHAEHATLEDARAYFADLAPSFDAGVTPVVLARSGAVGAMAVDLAAVDDRAGGAVDVSPRPGGVPTCRSSSTSSRATSTAPSPRRAGTSPRPCAS